MEVISLSEEKVQSWRCKCKEFSCSRLCKGFLYYSHTKINKCEIIEDSQAEKNKLATSQTYSTPFYGIFGQVQFVTGAYLILIEEATLIGELLQSGSEILRVEKLLYLPLTNTTYPAQM